MARRLAAVVFVLTSTGCYLGSARNVTPAELAADDGWSRIADVPVVKQTARRDCGSAALATVLGYWGMPVTIADVGTDDPAAPERGISAAALRDFARGLGLRAFVIEGTLADLAREIDRRRPVIVGVVKRYREGDYAHYLVVVGMNRTRRLILTIDPAEGMRQDTFEGFAGEWVSAKRLTLVVYPEQQAGAGTESPAPAPSRLVDGQPISAREVVRQGRTAARRLGSAGPRGNP